MAESFDPYYKWLGIPPKDQPPNCYRLLGIELFEHDRDVIDSAANRVMTYLKDLAIGDDAQHSQQLLNEVARARICLLNEKKREAYDLELRDRLREETATAEASTPPAAPPCGPPPASSPPPPAVAPPAAAPPPMNAPLAAATPPIPGDTSPPSAEIVSSDREFDFSARWPGDSTHGSVTDTHDPDSKHRPRRRRSSQAAHFWLIAVCLGALGMFLLVAWLLNLSHRHRGSGDPQRSATLALELDAAARAEITQLLLDGQAQPLPPRREYRLYPGDHQLRLYRPGYVPVSDMFTVAHGDRHVLRLKWKSERNADRPRRSNSGEAGGRPSPVRKLPKLPPDFDDTEAD